jgi:hypothetical protein
MNLPALQRKLSDMIEEYEEKLEKLPDSLTHFEEAGRSLEMAATIGGTFGNVSLNVGRVYESQLKESLLKSAWRSAYDYMQIDRIASAEDKRRLQQTRELPPAFTIENLRATFGHYIQDPRGNILRGLAEVFCSLDQSYKSHEKVKIGVKGLPKRVIISGVNSIHGWGKDRIENILNALATYQGKPLITWKELDLLMKDENALLETREIDETDYKGNPIKITARGVRLRRFSNGNGHLFFEPDTLRDINLALAEYYGDALVNDAAEKPTKKTQSTAVSKDLQYYPTPQAVVECVLSDVYIKKGEKILEPSCGCGRFMDAIKAKGGNVIGIEVDAGRANQCRAKGHSVMVANFLETVPTGDYDRVIMNPPFYGKHYAKHIEHAMKFLKPDGVLTAILPATARYDHGLLDGKWSDLPIGSFRESGTNINVTVLTKRK